RRVAGRSVRSSREPRAGPPRPHPGGMRGGGARARGVGAGWRGARRARPRPPALASPDDEAAGRGPGRLGTHRLAVRGPPRRRRAPRDGCTARVTARHAHLVEGQSGRWVGGLLAADLPRTVLHSSPSLAAELDFGLALGLLLCLLAVPIHGWLGVGAGQRLVI